MQRLTRRQRIAVGLWLVVGVVVWNAVFEMWVVREADFHLFRNALSAAGRGRDVPIAQVMAPAIHHATWSATFWASILVLTGLMTVRIGWPRGAPPRPSTGDPG